MAHDAEVPEEQSMIDMLAQEVAFARGKLVEKDAQLMQLLAIEQVRQAEVQAMLRALGDITVRMSTLQEAFASLVNQIEPHIMPDMRGDMS